MKLKKYLMVAGWLKKTKYKVAINLCKLIKDPNEIETIGKILKLKGIDILYFADSMGGLETKI